LHPLGVVLQYSGFAMHKKTNATAMWLQAQILRPAKWLSKLQLQRNMWLQYDNIATNKLVVKELYCNSIVTWG
jgi:hypothetical protein